MPGGGKCLSVALRTGAYNAGTAVTPLISGINTDFSPGNVLCASVRETCVVIGVGGVEVQEMAEAEVAHVSGFLLRVGAISVQSLDASTYNAGCCSDGSSA